MWPPTDRSRLASLGLPALLASDPGRSHRERVGSDARSALIWPREARRLRRCNRSLVRSPLVFNCNLDRTRAPIGCAD